MGKFKRFLLLFSFTLFVFCMAASHARATAPSCDCDLYDPNDPDEVDNYYACMAGDCGGVDIPVNGNVWGLALAGLVVVIIKAGAHRKFLLGSFRMYYRIRRAFSARPM